MAKKGSLSTRLVTQGGIYALGNVAVKASGFILAPILTNKAFLSVPEYGELSLLLITGALTTGAFSLGMPIALVRYLAKVEDGIDRASLPATALVTTVLGALSVGSAIWLLAPVLTSFFLETSQDVFLIRLFTVYIGFKVLGAVPYVMIRIKERAGLFVFATLLELGVLICSIYYFLVVRELGLYGVILGYCLSAGSASCLLTIAMFTRIKFVFSPNVARKLLQFGVPLALGGLAMPILRAGDQYVLKFLEGAGEVARYAWGTRISTILNMLFLNSFSLAFSILGMKAIGQVRRGGKFYRRTLRGYTLLGGLGVLGVSVLAYDLTLLVTRSPEYLDSVPLVFPLALGALTYGYYVIFVNFLFSSNRTPAVAGCTFFAAAVNIALNFLLIPLFGLIGAASATCLSYVVLTASIVAISKSNEAIAMPWKTVVKMLVLVVALYSVSAVLTFPGLLGTAARVIIVGLYLPLLLVFRLTRISELKTLWELGLAKARDVI